MSNEQYQAYIDACKSCAEICDECRVACYKENTKLMARCITLDTDCAEFCRLAIRFMQRDSEFCDLIREDCAEICAACAEECAKHASEHCQKCAEACKQCAEVCLGIAVAHPA